MNDISAFADAARVFANHLADVRLGPLAIALLLHTVNLLLRTRAWYSILRAAYPGVRYRYRSCAGAYLAGVGVNAIAPARGGDLVKIFLTRTRLEGSTTPTILASLLVETLIDIVLGGAATDSQLLSYSIGAQAAVMVSNALLGGIALVLMLRTLSLRSAIGHARHTQRADST